MARLIVIIAITFLFIDIVVSRPRLKRNEDNEPINLFVEKRDEGENNGNNGEQLQVAATTEENNIDKPIRYDDGPLYPRDFRASGQEDAPSTDDPVRLNDIPLYPNDNQLQQVEQNENTDQRYNETSTRFDNGGLTADLELNKPEDLQLDIANKDPNQVSDETRFQIDNVGLYPSNLQTNETDGNKLNEINEQPSTDALVRFDDGPLNQNDNQLQQLDQKENTDPNYNESPTRFDNGGLTADLKLNRPNNLELDNENKDLNQVEDDTHSQIDNGGLYPSNLQTNEKDDNKLNEINEQPSTDAPVRFDDGPLNQNDNQLQQVDQKENADPNYNETPTRFDNGGLTADLELNKPEDLKLENENKDLNQVGDDTVSQIDNGGLYPSNLQTNETDDRQINETTEQQSTDAPVRFDDGPLNQNDNQLQQVEQNENTDPNYNETPARFDNGGLSVDLELNRPNNLDLDNENKNLNQVGDDTHSQIDNGGLYPSNLQTNETDDSKLNETKEEPSTDASLRFDELNENDNDEDVHSSITDIYGDNVDKSQNDDIDSNADNFNGMRMKRFINQFEEDDLNDLDIGDDKNNVFTGKFDTNAADRNDERNNRMDSDVDPNANVSDKDDTDGLKADDTDNFNENDIDNPDEEDIDEDNIDKDDVNKDDIDETDTDNIDKDDVNKDDIDEIDEDEDDIDEDDINENDMI
ncbi:protein PFC0760c-like [Mytilus trossulus]|uniref:protein PFC0760c-like n=1 Tax=Mytilus trossulus TaxID=6551 RepID=UPI003007255E